MRTFNYRWVIGTIHEVQGFPLWCQILKISLQLSTELQATWYILLKTIQVFDGKNIFFSGLTIKYEVFAELIIGLQWP